MGDILYRTISILFTVIELAILARVVLSWMPMQRQNSIVNMLYMVTEPILAPIRGLLERSAFGRNMMFDFSPIIAFLIIGLIRNIVLRLLL